MVKSDIYPNKNDIIRESIWEHSKKCDEKMKIAMRSAHGCFAIAPIAPRSQHA
jgi:hypothetical protein